MAGLPKLPGFNFQDPTISKFHRSQTFNICNGYKQPKIDYSGIGGRELTAHSVKYSGKSDPIRYDPSLTYGRCKTKPFPQFLPHFALYDQKCLTFKAFFKQSVVESPHEFYRVRPVNIIYFLEDDTICVIEPRVANSGLLQGKLVKRSKIPKYEDGSYWHWKDFQVGKDLAFYGIVYHTVDCDLFTREYMKSQGLDMADPEEMPYDPYTFNRQLQVIPKVTKTPPADDKFRRFLEYDGKVLRFKAAWDDRENEYGDIMKFEILYFLSDDTVAVKNVQEENSGRDPYPVLLRKMKLPKIYTDSPVTYPAIYLEKTENEVTEYYQPKDFLVGNTIFVLGRDMLLYDCDKFTRDYFRNALGIEQKPAISVNVEKPETPAPQVPPHDGLGSLEDSLQNTLTFMPKPPRKDVMKQIVNANKYLRFEMKMDAVHPEDTIRRFILFYSLADGTCKIQEPPIKNSGILGGKYLRSTLLVKPESDPLNPELYTPADFYIGATIIVFGQRFIITGADLYVYRYMQENSSKFPCEVIESMRNWMFNQGYLKDDVEDLTKDKLDAKKVYDESIEERKQTDMEKCMQELKVGGGAHDPEVEEAKKQKILQEYEDSIKHTYKVPAHGILPVKTDCAYPVYIGEAKDLSCTEDIEGKYTSYTPKHIDTPEEIRQKYYAGVLKQHQDVCDGRYPVECSEPPSKEPDPCAKQEEKSGPLMVSPPVIPPGACKIDKKKVVRFSEESRCTTDRNDLCRLKEEITHCDCTDYKEECP
ncbi:EF-hand domain-containing protein 1-like [Anthonomus grandis grandis]|uniref:EF-hand domain-containing protein 1-like n=1 Tax=Anthonomus grandis grandis TaxID=2921223 RepID=UPI0021667936|nr:EF-hand domain-containing protein 1-like [Anthonomus grandis grandis]